MRTCYNYSALKVSKGCSVACSWEKFLRTPHSSRKHTALALNTTLCSSQPPATFKRNSLSTEPAQENTGHLGVDLPAEMCHLSPVPPVHLEYPCGITTATALSPQLLRQGGGGSFTAGNARGFHTGAAKVRWWHEEPALVQTNTRTGAPPSSCSEGEALTLGI